MFCIYYFVSNYFWGCSNCSNICNFRGRRISSKFKYC